MHVRANCKLLRDRTGAFRGAVCHRLQSEFSEILACRMRVQLAAESHVQKLHVELDNRTVVGTLNAREKNLAAVGPVTKEIKAMLKNFQDTKISLARRSVNGAAHGLAREGVCRELNNVWTDDPPDCILQIVASGMSEFFE